MCGIAGILSAQADPLRNLPRMLQVLQHRGPDGSGEYVEGPIALGHRRLSIIDLAGGRQPLHNAARTHSLICNGEIYNYRALRRDCEAHGHVFQTGSDSEVILALYARYGVDLLQHLRGMFAFALWDAPRQRLLLARDHLGQKPLYYQWQQGTLAFASEIKALLARSEERPRMNLTALDQYLALRLVDAPHSMFIGIEKLPPGHALVAEPGQPPRLTRYWDLQRTTELAGSDDELVDQLEAKLEETLRLHMVSDVPVGAFLSGGMDSGLIVAMLARKLGYERLPTFTMGLDYDRFDEAPAARAVAQTFRTEHHEERVRPQMITLLPELIDALDEPSDPLSLCTYLLAQFTRQHVKVVVGGDGGDELFGGYDRYFGLLHSQRYDKVPAVVRRAVVAPALALIPERGWYKSLGHQLRWLHRLSFHTGSARYAASLTYFYFDRMQRERLFAPGMQAEWRQLDAEAAIREPFQRFEGSLLERMLYADSKVRLPNHPVMITDRICMAHGLEARSPFMDHELAEFAMQLPAHMKVRGGSLRYIQRRLAARYLPPHMLNRAKQGFSSALPYLLQHDYARLYDRCLQRSRLVADGVLDGTVVQGLVAEQVQRRADHGNRLWLLLNAELWYRMKILGETKAALRDELENEPAAARRAS